MSGLSHVDEGGRARMVDVGSKPVQLRRARAAGRIDLAPATVRLVRENALAKGDVLTVAEVAGVQAAKRAGGLIPLCHPLELSHVKVDAALEDRGVAVSAEAACVGRTGAEMEALTAASVALLTVYDMCKAVDASMTIGEIRLLEKTKADPE
jgi:cyclic pyranopterin phosphate synthase